MPKWAGAVLRLGLVGLCLVYVLWGVDPDRMLAAFGRYGALPVLGAVAFNLVIWSVMALRVRGLSRGRAGFVHAFKATLLCQGLNNVMPAKLGEVAKAFYLRAYAGIPLPEGLTLVFWERFSDVNALLLMALGASWSLGLDVAAWPMALVTGGVWACLGLVRLFPATATRLCGLVPGERLCRLATETMGQFQGPVRPGTAGGLVAFTALNWTANAWLFWICLVPIAGLELGPTQALAAFVVTALSFAVPSSPGAVGVFEAACVLALGWFGVAKEEALAAGLLFRVVTTLPQTVAGFGVMAASGLSPAAIRRGTATQHETPS